MGGRHERSEDLCVEYRRSVARTGGRPFRAFRENNRHAERDLGECGIAAEYEDISDDEIPTEVAEKFAQLQAQYEALRAGATSDIEGAQQVAAKTAGRAVAGAAAAVAAVMAAVAVAKRRTI